MSNQKWVMTEAKTVAGLAVEVAIVAVVDKLHRPQRGIKVERRVWGQAWGLVWGLQ